jgi:hypothetical protein
MSKMVSYDTFRYLKHKLWLKERSGVKLTVWLLTTKSRELTRFPCVQVVCDMSLESSSQGLQLCLDFISIRGLHIKLWGPKVVGVPTLAILGVPRQKAIWMWASWRDTKYTIRGKVVVSPKSGLWWVLWVRVACGSS